MTVKFLSTFFDIDIPLDKIPDWEIKKIDDFFTSYELSKWIKLDADDKTTYPKSGNQFIVQTPYEILICKWDEEGIKFNAINDLSLSFNNGVYWQQLPQFPKGLI